MSLTRDLLVMGAAARDLSGTGTVQYGTPYREALR